MRGTLVLIKNKHMEEIKIGNQIWASFNLSVDKFANGDLIQEAKSFEEWEYCGLNRIPAFVDMKTN